MRLTTVLVVVIVAGVGTGVAEVKDKGANHFTVELSADVESSPEAVYVALVNVGQWWSPAHTYSGSAANLSLNDSGQGCFCEALPSGGSVRHMTVVYADPGKALRLEGGLGPLQGVAASGPLTWQLKPIEHGTRVELSYAVSGHAEGGVDAWAPAVDGVLAEQLSRLERYVETGSPDPGDNSPEALGDPGQ